MEDVPESCVTHSDYGANFKAHLLLFQIQIFVDSYPGYKWESVSPLTGILIPSNQNVKTQLYNCIA